MADRYWVGNGGTWDDSSTTHWSSSSGGASGASVPTASDNVFFDGNSFSSSAQTVTIPTGQGLIHSLNLDCSAVTNNPTISFASTINIAGSFTGGSITISVNAASTLISFNGSSNQTFTQGGAILNCSLEFLYGQSSSTVKITLLSDLSIYSPGFIFFVGGFDANGHNVTGGQFVFDVSNTFTVNMGSGTWTLKPSNESDHFSGHFEIWYTVGSGNHLTLLTSTATLAVDFGNATLGTYILTFFSPYNTLFNIKIIGNGTTSKTAHINTAVNCTNFTISGAPVAVQFAGTTYTISGTFTANGSLGKTINISSDSGSQTILSAAVASVSYVQVQGNDASGAGIPFDDRVGGQDNGDNTNWIFPSVGGAFLLNFF